MNHLAHLFLAGDTAESLIGNLAGDFVKGPLGDRFPPAIAEGIRNHRRVDAFTDSHEEVGRFRRVLAPEFSHYSRVISDMFFDHFLANMWNEVSDESLEDFLARVYREIDPRAGELPGRLAFVYPRLRDEAWLLSYRHADAIGRALYSIGLRLSRKPRLDRAVRYLTDERDALEAHFMRFFADLRAEFGK